MRGRRRCGGGPDEGHGGRAVTRSGRWGAALRRGHVLALHSENNALVGSEAERGHEVLVEVAEVREPVFEHDFFATPQLNDSDVATGILEEQVSDREGLVL